MKKLLLLIIVLLISCGQNNKVQTEKLEEINFFEEEYNFEYKLMGNEYSYNRWEELYYKGTPFTGIIHKNYKTYSQTIHYKEGKLHGPYREYYKDGTLRSRKEFDEGKPVGIHENYYENGNIEMKVVDGSIVHYFKSGNISLKITPEIKDVRDGVRLEYYESGQLERQIITRNGITRILKRYKENGELEEEFISE